MEPPKDGSQDESHETAESTGARLLADAEQATDTRKKLELLLRAYSEGDDIAKKSAEDQLVALGETCLLPIVSDVVEGLLHHCAGEPWRIPSESNALVKQVIKTVKQNADDILNLMFSSYGEVHLVIKTSILCATIIAVKERPERISEVVEAILDTWEEETDHVRRCTLKFFSNAAKEKSAIADEGFEVTLHGLEDVNPSVRIHALLDIYAYAKACPDKVDDVADAAFIGSDDVFPCVWPEAVRQLGELHGMFLERDWMIAFTMRDKYDDVDHLARVSVAKNLAAFAQSCPERIDEIYATAIRAYGDEHCLVRAAVVDQLVELVKFCPDKENEIVTAVLSACDDDEEMEVIESGIQQLANLLEACPNSAERIVEDALRLCPEFASDVILTMMQCSNDADQERRKRQGCFECPCVQTKAPRMA